MFPKVAAEVYYKFGAVVGVNTRDYKHNEDKCQVLITVRKQLVCCIAWLCAQCLFSGARCAGVVVA